MGRNTEEPPAGLFDRIISAIKKERELRKTKRLLFFFVFLFVISAMAMPFSLIILVNQMESSNIYYFVSTALSDIGIFFVLWKDFALAILELLPITGILAFAISLGTAIFTLRLFLYRKRLLVSYLKYSFS